MSLKFNPPQKVARYALFIDHGNGRGFFKTYNEVGFAKMAHAHRNYRVRNDAKILENVDGDWYVLYEVKAGTERENLPWMKEQNDWRHYRQGIKVAKPMTRDEYAEWRVQVERERVASSFSGSTFN